MAVALGANEPAQPLPRELCNLHKAEDIHAGSLGPRARRLLRPFSRQQGQPRQPHGRPGPQRAPGLEWRRQRVAVVARESLHLEAAAATPLRPPAECASPSRTIDGHPSRENSMERGAGRLREAGVGRAAGSCAPPSAPQPGRLLGACRGEARVRGAAHAPWPAGPGCPARQEAQTEPGVGGRAWHTGTHPSRHCSCLPASFPTSRVPSPLPTPTLEGGVSCHPLRVPPDLKDLTVSGIQGTINLPLLPQTKGEPSNCRLPKP